MSARVGVAGVIAAGMGAVAAQAHSLEAAALPVWSPNGKRVAAVVSLPRWTFQVEVVSPSGTGRRVVASFVRAGAATELRWAGGRRLIVSTSPDGVLRSIDVAAGTSIRLGPSPGGLGSGIGPLDLGADDAFAVSANGRRIAYVAASPFENANRTSQGPSPDLSAIGVVGSLGGPSHLLPQPINASDASPSFAPSGTQIVLARELFTNGIGSAPTLMTQSARGGQAASLHMQGEDPVWSPDGRWIAYQQMSYTAQGLLPSRLKIVSPGGINPHTVWTPSAHAALSISWAPNSGSIAFVTATGEIGTVTLAGKATIFRLPHHLSATGYPVNPPTWSPDGKTLLFAAAPGRNRTVTSVYAIGADGHGLRRIG